MTDKTGIIESDSFSYAGYDDDPPKPEDRGLNKWARELVSTRGSEVLYRVIVERVFPSGRIEPVSSEPKYQETLKIRDGWLVDDEWGDGGLFEAHWYLLPDGRRFKEVLQATIGDHDHFVALADEDGKIVPESLWTWEEWENKG
jgi:hypothetical protein